MDEPSKSQRIIQLASQLGVLRPRDLAPLGIQAEYLRRLCDRGEIRKLGRGSYVLAAAKTSHTLDLAIVARAVPAGVICLESALAFHGVELPAESVGIASGTVDLAIERRAAKPRLEYPPVRIWRLGERAFSEGIETHTLEQVTIQVYCLEKTLADLFKFRNKIGPHIAVDALRAALRQRPPDARKLMYYARLCRVDRVMRPYLDALAAQRARV